jgi:hypothetical protein
MTQSGKMTPLSPPTKPIHATGTEREALLLEVGVLPGSSRCFINLTTDGQSLRFYGTREKLAKQLAAIGKDFTPAGMTDGLRLGFRCRVRTIHIGNLTVVQRLLPIECNEEE